MRTIRPYRRDDQTPSSPSNGGGRGPRRHHEEARAMTNLLFVASSLFGDGSQSRLIASEFIDRWRQSHPRTTVVERDLTADSIPHLSLAPVAASMTAADTRSAAERQAVALADALIEEVEAADVI